MDPDQRHPSSTDAPNRRRRVPAMLVWLTLVAAVASLTAACGSSGSTALPVDDPCITVATGTAVPDWFPAEFRPPPGSVLFEILDEPEPDFGRTLTWCVDASYDDVVRNVETSLQSLSWEPTERTETKEDRGAKRTSFFLDNGALFAVRVFTSDDLGRVRLTAELPAS